MKQVLFPLFLCALLTLSCGSQQEVHIEADAEADTLQTTLEGDSTVYGLACDGCTDTILVLLPTSNVASNPDTFNILNATRGRRIYGKIHTGDNIAVVRNAKDSTVADCVIDLENLRETWCYQAMPTLHVRADMVGRTEKQMIANLPDSIRQLLAIPREYTMQIKSDHTVTSFGARPMQEKEEEQLVDYPRLKRYGQWHLYNGMLLLTEVAMDSVGNTFAVSTDTASFVLMDRDTLVLRFNDGVKNYYPKKD